MHKRRLPGNVELNLAAMLDMAFQLLAFFILTFRPTPLEGHIALRMPAPQPLTDPSPSSKPAEEKPAADPVQDLGTLSVTALANPDGSLRQLRIGQGQAISDMPAFEGRMQAIFADPHTEFTQVSLRVGAGLHYGHLMELLDICTRIKLTSGEKLTKLSFAEIPDQPAETP